MLNTRRYFGKLMKTMSKVIGISGVTNGGKTTLCEQLTAELEKKTMSVTHLNMDDYFWQEDSPHHVPLAEFNNYANWDDVCAVDWTSLISRVKEWKAASPTGDEPRLLLVEGIMIFNHRDMLPLFDKMYYITLPYDECRKRRQTRTYEPPDPEGYFDKIVWPYYLKFRDQVTEIPNLIELDGRHSQTHNLHVTLAGVRDLLQFEGLSP